LRLHYEEAGTGSPVLVLHGFTGSSAAVWDLVEVLATEHRAVAVDLIGHGKSPTPSGLAEVSMEASVAALDRLVADLGLETTHLVGYSLGGRVALSYAVANPNRLRSVLLIGASAGIADAAERARRRDADRDLADLIEINGLEWFVDHWAAQPILQPGSARGEAAAPGVRRQRMANNPEALALVLRGLGTGSMPPLHDALGVLDLPVGLVAGEHDPKYRAIAEDLMRRLPNGENYVVPGSGHAVPVDNPDALGELALRFVAASNGRDERGPAPAPTLGRREG
jgi:2-succinyl-6-hydroxy-2,4-cyclohexadiene-1-carboxylate synthase